MTVTTFLRTYNRYKVPNKYTIIINNKQGLIHSLINSMECRQINRNRKKMCFFRIRIFWITWTRLSFRSCTSLHHVPPTLNFSNRIVLILKEKNLLHARARTLSDFRATSLVKLTLDQTIKWKVQRKISSVMWVHSPIVTKMTHSRILLSQMRLKSTKM